MDICVVLSLNFTISFPPQVKELPWNQDELASETLPFVDKLAHVNKHGILTINSQPVVNAVSSTDPVAGWGRPGGYIFQKVTLGIPYLRTFRTVWELSRFFLGGGGGG